MNTAGLLAPGTLGFVLLFPLYFIYHWLSLGGAIPRFLGGFVNEASLLVVLMLMATIAVSCLRPRSNVAAVTPADIVFAVFICFFATVVAAHAGLGSTPTVVRSHAASIGQLAAAYLVFRLFPYRSRGAWRLVAACFIVLSTLVLEAAYRDLLGLLLSGSDDSAAATYQGLARGYLMVAILALTGLRHALPRWLGYLLTLFVLFLIGARSEVAGAVILFTAFEIASSRAPWRVSLRVAVAIAFTSVAVWLNLDVLDEIFPENRLLFLLAQGTDDGSVSERQVLQGYAWSTIQAHPLMGDFGHYESLGGAGAYAHNLLSAWVDLGVVGLILIIAAFWVSVAGIIATATDTSDSAKQHRALCVALMALTVFLFAFAKNFTDPSLGVAVGSSAALYGDWSRRRRSRAVASAGGRFR